MSLHLGRFPEYQLELGVLWSSVAGDEMLRMFESFDKNAKWLAVFCEDVDLSSLDVAHIPAMKRAVTPDQSEPHSGEPELTAFVNLAGGGEFFARFWMHYASLGVQRTRKREMFPTVAAACQWLGLPPPASETLAAAVADAVGTGAEPTVGQAEQSENRRRILKAASRLFRERGYDGVAEAEIMEAAGLGRSGLEGYFGSRDNLIFHALAEALANFKPPEELADYACYYLSAGHRADIGGGCPAAALASETVRQSAEARAAMTAGLDGQIESLSRSAPGRDAPARRRAAIRACSALVGSLILARMSDDEELAREFVDETLAWIAEQDKPPGGSTLGV
jgi:TetR/AcrR family transcriptional repressor of nem operon